MFVQPFVEVREERTGHEIQKLISRADTALV